MFFSINFLIDSLLIKNDLTFPCITQFYDLLYHPEVIKIKKKNMGEIK